MAEQYYLEVKALNVGVFAGINDVSIVSDASGEGVSTLRPINEWILPKRNCLTVSLAWPAGKEFKPGLASVEASVFVADPDSPFPAPGQVLARASWPTVNHEEAYPFEIAVPFEIRNPTGATLWDRATPVRVLTPRDEARILEMINGFELALLARDAQRAYSFVAYRFEDDAAAYGKDPERIREVVLEQYEMLMSEPGFSVVPFDKDKDVEFEIVGMGCVVMVSRAGGGAAIQLRADSMNAEIAVFASKLDNEWIIGRTA